MAHWEHRDEENWKRFEFNQPYEKGLKRLKEEVLAKTDYDPATLWQWGTMQALAVIEILKACESTFGADGQKLVYAALQRIGHDIGRQILEGTAIPKDMTVAEHSAVAQSPSLVSRSQHFAGYRRHFHHPRCAGWTIHPYSQRQRLRAKISDRDDDSGFDHP